jgi:hypothetical protein
LIRSNEPITKPHFLCREIGVLVSVLEVDMVKKNFSKTGRTCRVTFDLPAHVEARKAFLCGNAGGRPALPVQVFTGRLSVGERLGCRRLRAEPIRLRRFPREGLIQFPPRNGPLRARNHFGLVGQGRGLISEAGRAVARPAALRLMVTQKRWCESL